jgi:ATP-dependent Clp protease ATP-binding subunit ClpC
MLALSRARSSGRRSALADDGATPVVRRYREGPSPLVRDSARSWRTGKLERVLDGDFDIIV